MNQIDCKEMIENIPNCSVSWKEDKKLLESYEANLMITELKNKHQNSKFILSNCNKVEERLKKGYVCVK